MDVMMGRRSAKDVLTEVGGDDLETKIQHIEIMTAHNQTQAACNDTKLAEQLEDKKATLESKRAQVAVAKKEWAILVQRVENAFGQSRSHIGPRTIVSIAGSLYVMQRMHTTLSGVSSSSSLLSSSQYSSWLPNSVVVLEDGEDIKGGL